MVGTAFSRLENKIDYHFHDKALLKRALTHRSFGQYHNERFEFLGDGILNAVAAHLLFVAFPTYSEGELSRLRANLVKKESLAQLATQLDLGPCLWLGDGEAKNGGSQRPSILADALEAVFAAVFLDGGFEAARHVVACLLNPLIATFDAASHDKDNKTRLQEWLQARKYPLPQYLIISQLGHAHQQCFEVICQIDVLNLSAHGKGANRRAAEQDAAEAILAQLRDKI